MTIFAIAVFAIAYALIASEKVHRVKVALTGAALMLAAGVLDFEQAFHEPETGVDWEVILLLLGMMIIVGVLSKTGVFEYVAIRAAKGARGRPFRVMALLVLITAVASAALDNVTTVLLVAPVTLLVCSRLGLDPVPYLLAEVFASNVGGTATLIGDPPNIIIAGRAGLSFNDFLVHLLPIVVVLIGALLLTCRVLFSSSFVHDPGRAAEIMELDEREAISDPRLLVKSGIVLLGVLIGFVASATTGTAPATVALLGAGVLVLISGLPPRDYLADVEAPTLLFFVGLFIMVGALIEVGAIERLAELATQATGGDVQTATFLLLGVSAVLSAVIDNIPYVATMAPLVETLSQSTGNPDNVLWWSLALGADLGGNATIIGASANVVMLGIAEKNGHRISFWQFAKYGVPVTLVTVLLCVPYLWLRYFAVG
jgi:Na+/H+ antiporter NhaD/arsenite permease-like protein